MKPRVLIFSVAYEPLVGGAELAVRNITDRLSSYEFDLVTCRFSRRHKARERIGNVNVYRVGFGSRVGRYLYPVFAWRQARQLHRKRPYAAVWSIMAAYAGAAALMFLRRFPKVKYLLTLQEGDSFEHIRKRVRGFKKVWQEVFKRADYIQAISRYLADWAKIEGAECSIEIVPNGVDPLSFSPLQRGRLRGGKTIITTSRLVPKNGIDILIRGFAVIASGSHPFGGSPVARQSQLQILGSGPDEAKLKKLAKELNVADKIQFFGHVEPQKIPAYLAAADIFVRPSRSEGLGSSFLEAMAAGLPVVGTNVGGITDFLKDGETGLLTRPEDPKDLAQKIQRLLDDAGLRQKLGENGRNLVEKNYSWERVAGQMDEIFKKLLV